jgi:hypothetical protein
LRKKFVRIVPLSISKGAKRKPGGLHGRIVVAQRKPTQKSVPAKIPAKKGLNTVSDQARVTQDLTHGMMYASHVWGAPLQQLLRSPLHNIQNDQRQGYTDKRWEVTNEEKRNEEHGKRPEEDEPAQEPPCVLHTWYRELSRVPVLVETSFHQSAMPLPGRVHLLCRDLWRLTIVVFGEPVCSVLE